MELREHRRGAAAALVSLLARGELSLTVDDLPFTLTGLSWRKRLNLLAGGVQKRLRPPFRVGRPLIVQVEPTNTCNLRCPVCATGAGLLTRPPARMPWDRYVRVIDEVKGHACFLFFWSWGEPFLHPDACRMIRYAREQGLRVHACTNGHAFANPAQAEALVASGLDSLIFAVDGLDAATYAAYREGGSLETVLTSIRNVVRARAAAGRARPFLALRFIVMKHNEQQLGGVEAFARELGVDAVTWRSALVVRDGRQFGDRLAPTAPDYRRSADPAAPGAGVPAQRRPCCNRPYANLTVFSGGEVVFCENDYNARFAIGHVDRTSLRDALASGAARAMLRGFRRGTPLPPFCSGCEFCHDRRPTLNVTTRLLRPLAAGGD
jgi:MoaA/NifB/PqqE/SkfB family radical SAM enzyme